MANQRIWDYANSIAAKMMLFWSIFTIVGNTVLYFLLPFDLAMTLSIFLLLIGLGIGMFWCETQLNRHFDKNGHPKDKA